MNYKIITPITNEPIALVEAKLHIRVSMDDTAEDSLIEGFITAAREYVENYARRALALQTVEAYLPKFPCSDRIELPRPPLQNVLSVSYKNSAGIETTMTANVDYLVDTENGAGVVVLPYGKNWPSYTPYPVNSVKIRYIAGYTYSNLIPKSIKQAMFLLIGHWYENREAVVIGSTTKEIEFAVKALLGMYKSSWF